MKLIEEFIKAKTGKEEDCEDNYLFNNHFAAVIDGASNVSDKELNGQKPGKLASIIIKQALEALNGNEYINQIIQRINEEYEYTYEKLGISASFEEEPYLRPSAALIVYSHFHQKIWMIGDCQCYFNQTWYQNIKRIDEVFEEARSILVKGELLKGKSTEELQSYDVGYELIKPFIRQQYYFQNYDSDPLGYGVVNGLDIPNRLIKEILVPNETEFISFASDGYSRIFDNLKDTEKELKRLLKLDPLCIKDNMGVKALHSKNLSFDDRTYIKIKIK